MWRGRWSGIRRRSSAMYTRSPAEMPSSLLLLQKCYTTKPLAKTFSLILEVMSIGDLEVIVFPYSLSGTSLVDIPATESSWEKSFGASMSFFWSTGSRKTILPNFLQGLNVLIKDIHPPPLKKVGGGFHYRGHYHHTNFYTCMIHSI